MFRWPLTFLLFLLCSSLQASSAVYAYDYNDNCSRAYQHFMALHMPEGRAAIAAEAKANPNNLMAIYIADYEDCLTLLLNCDKDEYEQRRAHFETRLEMLNRGSETSPWYLFCKAGIYMHWAIVCTRFGEQYRAALRFRKALSLLNENQRRFPRFEYNRVFLGLEESVIGSLPGSYKWLAAIFGIKGDVKKGMNLLTTFINTHTIAQPLYAETALYYAYIRFYMLSEQKEVWNFLNTPQFPVNHNLLNTFVKVNIALDYHKSEAAAADLAVAATDAAYIHYPVFEYQMGLATLPKADITSISYFKKYLGRTKSDLYVKESWQKMAWSWYIAGNMKQAEYCRQQIKLYGAERLDADRQAQKFAETGKWPLKPLLQARLLIDGGYTAQALGILNTISIATLANPADRTEYYFRLGRVHEELAEYNKALANYRNAISHGKDRHEQFAARAALQMGVIYERAGMTTNALSSYNQCLDMPSHDFQNSIDQLAKAGINRLEGE